MAQPVNYGIVFGHTVVIINTIHLHLHRRCHIVFSMASVQWPTNNSVITLIMCTVQNNTCWFMCVCEYTVDICSVYYK